MDANKKKSLVGKVFGFRTVIEEDYFSSKGIELCLCECACGKRKLVRKWSLLNGLSHGCMSCPRRKEDNYKGKWKRAASSPDFVFIKELNAYKKNK